MAKVLTFLAICLVVFIGIALAVTHRRDQEIYLKRCTQILAEPDLQAFSCSAWMEEHRPKVYEDGSRSGPQPGELWPGPRTCAEAARQHNTSIDMQQRKKENCLRDPSSGGG